MPRAATNSSERMPTIEPRGLRREDAARYIGISPGTFDTMVKDGRMPRARIINSCRVWDRRELDNAFDDLPNVQEQPRNEFDGVRA